MYIYIYIDEKNEQNKETLRKKATEYLNRAEQLKSYLKKKQKNAVSANGSSGGKNKLVIVKRDSFKKNKHINVYYYILLI